MEKLAQDLYWVGVNDHQIDLFEGQYKVKNGMAYNSYIIKDEKVAVLDTSDQHFTKEWLANIEEVLGDKEPDYLIVHHMEPDHSANIQIFMDKYKKAQIVASAKAFVMMGQFFGTNWPERQVVMGEGTQLSLGKHTLTFVTAPMVHWPEVLMSFDDVNGCLFAADGFGKFGARDVEEPWDDEARRYYIGIVGKYGNQVQMVLKKAATLPIKMICSLHGPTLTKDLGHYISLYDKWSSYTPECDGIVIAYASIYGHTKDAAYLLKQKLEEKGAQDVKIYDLARSDMAEVVSQAFKNKTLVLVSVTYNLDCYPFMKDFINHLTERSFQKRTIGMIQNGTWAPNSANVMKKMLEGSKDLTYVEPVVLVKSALNDESRAAIDELATALLK